MGRKKTNGTCRLCQEVRTLCDSHIVPEFVYSPVYLGEGNDHWTIGIRSTRYSDGWEAKKVQKGLREPLLCRGCEELLNREYEQPSVPLWRALTGKEKTPPGVTFQLQETRKGNRGTVIHGIDYLSFKLFLLSILWRCSVSSRANYQEVNLGPYEETLGQMILERDPGDQGDFPFLLWLLEEPQMGLVSPPFEGRFEGHRCYGILLSSVAPLFLVSGHLSEQRKRQALHPSGRLVAPIIPGHQHPLINRAKKISQRLDVPANWIAEGS